jgi:periplasmic divalent cation tolerance protein
MAEEVVEVALTAADPVWLGHFLAALADERLIACGNISSPQRSIYRWKGRIADEQEVRATLHTRASLVPAIVDRVRRDHPYDLPGVLVFPIVAGTPEYLEWVVAETHDPGQSA